ncbi:DUF1972 domain-containing protein [Neobacillus drentensis]|uniref:DUF1972 domain-containing protein n=1 Tax=Neobacillus drentensis TaxID=220684 RepID=UPI003B5864FA
MDAYNTHYLDIFFSGSSNYGGFETFVSNLTEFKKSKDIKCHVACLDENYDEIEYDGAR